MTLRGVRVNRKLFDILTNHGPKAFGPLYMPSVLPFPNDPGFYKVLGPSEEDATMIQDQTKLKLVAYMDKNIAPPLHFFHHQEAVAGVSEKALVGGLIAKSFVRRETLLSGIEDTHAMRVLNGRRDGVPGITIDFYTKKHVLVAVTSGYWLVQMNEIVRYILQCYPAVQSIRLVDLIERAGKRSYSGKVIWKAEGTLPSSDCHVKEGNCTYLVNLTNGLSTGLFHDQARSREAIPFLVPPGASMLNLFAYTCAFSVAAAEKNKLRTTNVDISERSLKVGENNFVRNGLSLKEHTFVKRDVFEFLEHNGVDSKFDLVVCDPPTLFSSSSSQASTNNDNKFRSRKGMHISCNKHYDLLVAAAARAVKKGGHLVLFCNSHSIRKNKWLSMIQAGLDSVSLKGSTDTRSFVLEKEFQSSPDYFDDTEEPDLKGASFKREN